MASTLLHDAMDCGEAMSAPGQDVGARASSSMEASLLCELCGQSPKDGGPSKDVKKWAVVNRHKGEEIPVGYKCFLCASVSQRSFPHLSWDELVFKAKTSTTFRSLVYDCRLRLDGKPKTELLDESADETSTTTAYMQRNMLFMTAEEIHETYSVKASHLGLPEVTVIDETGAEVKGYLLRNPALPFRQYIVSSATAMSVHKTIMKPQDCLRQGQGDDLLHWLNTEKLKQLTPALHSVPRSEEKFNELLASARAKQEAESAGPDAAPVREAAPLEGLSLGLTPEKDAEEDENERMEVVEAVPVSLAAQYRQKMVDDKKVLSPVQKRGKLARGRGGRGRGAAASNIESETGGMPPSKRLKRKTCTGSSSIVGPSVATTPSGSSGADGASVCESNISTSPQDKLLAQAVRYASMDVSWGLTGQTVRNTLNLMSRVSTALEDRNQTDLTEYSNLMANKNLLQSCGELAEKMSNTDRENRMASMAELAPYFADRLPTQFQVKWLSCYVRDFAFRSIDDVKAWLNTIKPYASGPAIFESIPRAHTLGNPQARRLSAHVLLEYDCSRYQWRCPRICDMDDMQNEVESWRLVLKSVVNDTLVRLISKGAESRSAMALLAYELSKQLADWKAAITSASLAHTAHQELEDIVMFVRMLAEDLPPEHRRLHTCMTANQGNKQVLKNAVIGNKHWKDMEAKLRRSASNMAAMTPELEQARNILTTMQGFDVKELQKVSARVPVWRDALPRGSTELFHTNPHFSIASRHGPIDAQSLCELDDIGKMLKEKVDNETAKLAENTSTSSWEELVQAAGDISRALDEQEVLDKASKAKTKNLQNSALDKLKKILQEEALPGEKWEVEASKTLHESWSRVQQLGISQDGSLRKQLEKVLPDLISRVVSTLAEKWEDLGEDVLENTKLLLEDVLEMAQRVPHCSFEAWVPEPTAVAIQAELLQKLAVWRSALSSSRSAYADLDIGALTKVAGFESSACLPTSMAEGLKQTCIDWLEDEDFKAAMNFLTVDMAELKKCVLQRCEADLQTALTAAQSVQGGRRDGLWHESVKGVEFSDFLFAANKSLLTTSMYTDLRKSTSALTKASLTQYSQYIGFTQPDVSRKRASKVSSHWSILRASPDRASKAGPGTGHVLHSSSLSGEQDPILHAKEIDTYRSKLDALGLPMGEKHTEACIVLASCFARQAENLLLSNLSSSEPKSAQRGKTDGVFRKLEQQEKFCARAIQTSMYQPLLQYVNQWRLHS
eukprot:458114-Amphidinium_carterae.3